MRQFSGNKEPVFLNTINDMDYHIVKLKELPKTAFNINAKVIKLLLINQSTIDNHEIQLYDEKHLLCFIQYVINELCLKIEYIEKTPIAQNKYTYDHHLGTNIFNALLLHLYEKKIKINKISGLLSRADATRNWHDSIPFYADFNLYLHKKLPYQLVFHLFSDSKYKNEVQLPTDWYNRKVFIENFIEEHIKSNSWASFQYDVVLH